MLERLLGRLEAISDDLVVFVGDLVGNGPDEKGVLDVVGRPPNVPSVRGNVVFGGLAVALYYALEAGGYEEERDGPDEEPSGSA